MTFFSQAKYRFHPIPEDKRIETYPFLQACQEIVPFFGKSSFCIIPYYDVNYYCATKVHINIPLYIRSPGAAVSMGFINILTLKLALCLQLSTMFDIFILILGCVC